MRDTIITRVAELMSDMQLFATVGASPQEHDDRESAGGPNRENTADEPTQRRDEPANRWIVSSHASSRVRALLDPDHNASIYNDDASDRSGSRDIQFGLSPNAVPAGTLIPSL